MFNNNGHNTDRTLELMKQEMPKMVAGFTGLRETATAEASLNTKTKSLAALAIAILRGCEDCLTVAKDCDQPCNNNCDCAQPWTACGVGSRQVCTPLGCAQCYATGQYCCWCPADVCGNVTCVAPGATCPSC